MTLEEYVEVCKSFNKLRLENTDCDVVIQIGQVTFPAHRFVLKARMKFFQNMFNAEMKEKNEPVVKLESTIVSPDVFEDILNYIYTSELNLTDENAALICVAANFFCDEKLVKKAESFLETNLKIDNVSQYLEIAMRINLKLLEEKCKDFLVKNFLSETVKHDLISWFLFEDLNMILRKFRKHSKREDMFHFAIAWVELDEAGRESKLPELLESIPLSCLRSKFLKEIVAEEKILLKNNECLRMLVNLFKQNFSNSSIYVFGGTNEEPLSSVSKFESSTGLWSEATLMSDKRSHFGSVVVEDKIYLCGGDDGESTLNILEVFETKAQTFRTLTPMKHPRENCGVAELNGFLYVAGGGDSNNEFDVVEKYSIETNEWKEVSPMRKIREGLQLVELNGKLYALGGHDGRDVLNSVECYYPEEDRWKFKASMENYYASFGAVSFKNRIYVVGREKSEVYNPQEDWWEEIPSPNECGYGRSLIVFEDNLVVIGGSIEGMKGIQTVQYYDFINRAWKTAKDTNIARCYHSAAVINDYSSPPFNL